MRQVTNPDGTVLVVHDQGGTGRPALLCHATGLHAAVWEPLAAALPDGLDRWAIDFRAHGASVVPPDHPLTWSDFTADVLAAVDGLGLAPGEVLGIGHSMGGAALLLAEQARPGTFAGLWLFEPIVPPLGGLGDPSGSNPLADRAERRRPTFPSAAAALANYASKRPLHHLRADALHAYVRHGFAPDPTAPADAPETVRLACRPIDEARTFRGAAGHDAFDHLPKVACPVVIARGGESFGPAMFAPAAVERLPAGRLDTYADLGHFGPLEAPDRLAADVAAFAATLP